IVDDEKVSPADAQRAGVGPIARSIDVGREHLALAALWRIDQRQPEEDGGGGGRHPYPTMTRAADISHLEQPRPLIYERLPIFRAVRSGTAYRLRLRHLPRAFLGPQRTTRTVGMVAAQIGPRRTSSQTASVSSTRQCGGWATGRDPGRGLTIV